MLLNIGLTYNLKRSSEVLNIGEDYYAEFDEQSTIDAIADALSKAGKVIRIEADEDAYTVLRKTRLDVVFNIAEGLRGESRESHIPAMLEMLSIPYTGSGPLTLAIALNKAVTHTVLSARGLRTPKHRIFRTLDDIVSLDIEFPLVVKPLQEGSSKGIWNNSLVNNRKELRERVEYTIDMYQQPALVEEFINGREFTIALLGNSPPRVLPIIEVKLDRLPQYANRLYSYEAKWVWDTCEHPVEILEYPAVISEVVCEELTDTALQVFKVLGCRDVCRIDVRLDGEGRCCVLDVNPLPGLIPDPHAHSALPTAAKAAGLNYNELITSILFHALDRYGIGELVSEVSAASSLLK